MMFAATLWRRTTPILQRFTAYTNRSIFYANKSTPTDFAYAEGSLKFTN